MLRRKQGKIARSLTLVLTIATCTGNKTKRKKWDCIKQRFCITNEKLIKMTQSMDQKIAYKACKLQDF